jgi:hypothetical protein
LGQIFKARGLNLEGLPVWAGGGVGDGDDDDDEDEGVTMMSRCGDECGPFS